MSSHEYSGVSSREDEQGVVSSIYKPNYITKCMSAFMTNKHEKRKGRKEGKTYHQYKKAPGAHPP